MSLFIIRVTMCGFMHDLLVQNNYIVKNIYTPNFRVTIFKGIKILILLSTKNAYFTIMIISSMMTFNRTMMTFDRTMLSFYYTVGL